MAPFYISRKTQHIILVEGCSGHDTRSRDLRLQVAKLLKVHIADEPFHPTDLFSYDLSLCLEKLDNDVHTAVFKAYLDMI